MKNEPYNKAGGFSLIEIMIVVSVIGLLAAVAIPNFVQSRGAAQLRSVINNLRVIESAKDQWATQNKKGTGDTTDMVLISDYLKGGTIQPVVGEDYTTNPIGTQAYAVCPTRLGTYAAGDLITAE